MTVGIGWPILAWTGTSNRKWCEECSKGRTEEGVDRSDFQVIRDRLPPGVRGKKPVCRLYRALGLQMRTKRRRRLFSEQRGAVEKAQRANQRWAMDFVTDRLEGGRYFCMLTVVDQYTGNARCWNRYTR